MSEPHPQAIKARAAKLAAAEAIGIDAPFIDRLVEAFYAKVREDPVLAPVFAARITDWPPHLARMKQFWAVILRGEGSFNGSPMALHAAIDAIGEFHFRRWLALFEATLRELEGDPAATALVAGRARTIADSLLTGIRIHRDGRRDLKAMKGLAHA
jgi:hemoglobin